MGGVVRSTPSCFSLNIKTVRNLIIAILVVVATCVIISCNDKDKDDIVVIPDTQEIDVFVYPIDSTDYNPFYVTVLGLTDTIYDDWSTSILANRADGLIVSITTDEPGGVCASFKIDGVEVVSGYSEDASYEPLKLDYQW